MTGLLHSSDGPRILPAPRPGHAQADFLDATRSPPAERVRSRREARERRRAAVKHARTAQRLAALGPGWQLIDLRECAGTEPMTYLAIGPGGVFAVTVK